MNIKLISALFFIGFSWSCNTSIYIRSEGDFEEKIKLHQNVQEFKYIAQNMTTKYIGHGTFETDQKILKLTFPPYAELKELSPFKKGYYELKKIGEQDNIEIYFTAFDLETLDTLTPFRSINIRSEKDDAFQERIDRFFPIELNSLDNYLKIGDNSSFVEQTIKLETTGKYELCIFLQRKLTNYVCSIGVSSEGGIVGWDDHIPPIIEIYVCGMQKKEITSLSFDPNCNICLFLKNKPTHRSKNGLTN